MSTGGCAAFTNPQHLYEKNDNPLGYTVVMGLCRTAAEIWYSKTFSYGSGGRYVLEQLCGPTETRKIMEQLVDALYNIGEDDEITMGMVGCDTNRYRKFWNSKKKCVLHRIKNWDIDIE